MDNFSAHTFTAEKYTSIAEKIRTSYANMWPDEIALAEEDMASYAKMLDALEKD